MKLPIVLLLGLAIAGNLAAQVRINEITATSSDRLLVREAGQYPRVGNARQWNEAAYDDSHWRNGTQPIGFGTFSGVTIATNLAADMQNRAPGLFIRKTFTVSAANAASGSTLLLPIRYNDGFVAFLNGVEIARRNMGNTRMFAFRDQTAFNARTSSAVESIDLGPANSRLVTGENLLCIQVHNHSLAGAEATNLLVSAELRISGGATLVPAGGTWRYFTGHAEPSGGLIDHGLLNLRVTHGELVPWAVRSFNDSTWPAGIGPVGIERANPPHYLLGTNLEAETYNITPSIYIRHRFTATAAEAASSFALSTTIDYDDGFILYINGREALRRNLGTAGTRVPNTALAGNNHNASNDNGDGVNREELIPLAAAGSFLVTGENVMAIQLHRASLTSADAIARVSLRTTGSAGRVLVQPGDPVRYFVGITEPITEGGDGDVSGAEDAAEDEIDSENDWIELHNAGTAAVSLDGWSLSDNLSSPRKWSFPNGVTLPAGGYLVVMATGLDTGPADGATYHHTNFRLSASGEPLVLTRPDNTVEDQLEVPFPAQTWRHSYGRIAGGPFGFLATATPGEANTGPLLMPPPAAPEFSVQGGFHPSAVSVALSSATPGATIRYTLNGTDPLNGTLYTGPISFPFNGILRARAFLTNAAPSAAVTHTYLINQAAARRTLAAICLGGDPTLTYYGPNTSGSPPGGEGVLAIKGGSYSGGVWSPGSDTSAFNIPMTRGRAMEKPATLEYLPLTGPPLRTGFGLRIAASSYSRPRMMLTDPASARFDPWNPDQKPSFNLYFRSEFGDRPLDYPFIPESNVSRFQDVRVRAGKNDVANPFIRDEMMRRIFRNTGQIGSVGAFNTLWVNGVYKGYYNITERLREGFMQEHHQSSASWDVQQVNEFSSGDALEWNKFISFLRTTNFNQPSNHALLKNQLDVDNYIDYILVNAFAATWDWPNNNWVAARERTSNGRWRFYMWDAEGAFGLYGIHNLSHNTFTSDLTIGDAQTTTWAYIPAIFTLLKDSPEFRLRFADRAQKQLFNNGALVQGRMTSVFNQLRIEINPIMQNTIGQAVDQSFHNEWVAGNSRRNTFLNQLSAQGFWPSVQAPVLSQHGGQAGGAFQLSISNPNAAGTIHFTTNGDDPRAPGGRVTGTSYSGPITIALSTRVRARVFSNRVWSPEIDVSFQLPVTEPEFIPAASGDWTDNTSWTSAPDAFPNDSGALVIIPGAAGADRNVNLRASVTVGRITFAQGASAFRNRVRDQPQPGPNTLTLSQTQGPAEILVTGTGSGFAELEVLAGTVLASPLKLDVSNVNGNSEHGALRLRGQWSGPGGITKSGLGIASLTGEEKNFNGPTVIEQGVLQITGPATPGGSSSITVADGGQLRLISSSSPGQPRVHTFGGPIALAGPGRGPEIDEAAHPGKLGALRYDPGSNNSNHAIITNPVVLTAPACIHVEDRTNSLELANSLTGDHTLMKSGGGTLILSGNPTSHSPFLQIDNGGLEIGGELPSAVWLSADAKLTGSGRTGEITGEGLIELQQTILESPASSATRYSLVLGQSGLPSFDNPQAAGNAIHLVESGIGNVLQLDLYLLQPTPQSGEVHLGGLATPLGVDLAAALATADIRVFVPTAGGPQNFNGAEWSEFTNCRVTTVAHKLPTHTPFDQVRILELLIGPAAPAKFSDWQASQFTNPSDLANPGISGAAASPFGDDVPNLLRYAFGVPPGQPASRWMPQSAHHPGSYGLTFPFDSRRDDLVVVVEASEAPDDWTNATVIFDSRVDFPPVPNSTGWSEFIDPLPPQHRRFYRAKVIKK